MSHRRPAESHVTSRTSGAAARSPAERLEPTRPVVRRRRQRFNRHDRPSRPIVRLLSGAFTLLLLVMFLVAGAGIYVQSRIAAPGPLTVGKAVTVPKGEGAHEIAARLEREGVVTDRRLFVAAYLLARLPGRSDGRALQLKAGDYLMPPGASIKQVLDIISEGKTLTFRVTIPEGLTSDQIVERLASDTNLSGEVAQVPPEGSLLPETYIVSRGANRQAIIERMQGEARKLSERLWDQRKKDLPLKTWQEAVILASVVEKETGRNDERERVAAVFINRLRQNMRLQSDPTILYGISAGKTVWNRPILRSEIAKKTDHNTYQIDGLPPTPICNPGRAAIEAVLNPADTKDLYFVADGSGGHIFSETLKDHNANVQKWRVLEKEMKAKSGPADTPTTAQPEPKSEPKTRAVIRKPPAKSKGGAASGKGDKTDPDGKGWTSTTQPSQQKKK